MRFKAFPETLDAVGGGEDEPVVCAEIADGVVDAGVIFERLDVDGGELDDLGTEIGKLRGKPAGLFAGAGHDHAAAEEGLLFKPVQAVAQGDDLAHDDDGWVGEPLPDTFLVERPEGGGEAAVLRRGAPVHEGRRGVGGKARFDEVPGDVGKVLHAHDEHEGVRAGGEGLPVVDGAGLIGVFVSGDEGYGRGKTTVRQGDARIGRARDGAGDAGDFLERHARVQQFLGLFAAPAEDVGIAAFEPGDDFAFFGFFYDELVDAVLRERMVSGDLADVNAFRVGPGIAEQGVVGEVVIHDHIGLFENVLALDGQQTGVAGSGADEIDFHAILVVFLSHPGVIPRVREAGLMNTCLVKAERPCLGSLSVPRRDDTARGESARRQRYRQTPLMKRGPVSGRNRPARG